MGFSAQKPKSTSQSYGSKSEVGLEDENANFLSKSSDRPSWAGRWYIREFYRYQWIEMGGGSFSQKATLKYSRIWKLIDS